MFRALRPDAPPIAATPARYRFGLYLACLLVSLISCSHARHDGFLAPACAWDTAALSAYLELVQASPGLFEPRGDHTAGEVEIVVDPARIRDIEAHMFAQYRRHKPDAEAWASSRAGVIMADDYILLLRDAVVFPSGKVGLYDRKISTNRRDGGPVGGYTLPIAADGRVVLVREWRHQERIWRLGLPGGYRDAGETAAQSARREAREETGCDLPDISLLGEVDPDTERVPLFWGRIQGACEAIHPDPTEALGGTVFLTMDAWHKALLDGFYDDDQGHHLLLHGTLATAYVLAKGRLLL